MLKHYKPHAKLRTERAHNPEHTYLITSNNTLASSTIKS